MLYQCVHKVKGGKQKRKIAVLPSNGISEKVRATLIFILHFFFVPFSFYVWICSTYHSLTLKTIVPSDKLNDMQTPQTERCSEVVCAMCAYRLVLRKSMAQRLVLNCFGFTSLHEKGKSTIVTLVFNLSMHDQHNSYLDLAIFVIVPTLRNKARFKAAVTVCT